MATISVLNLPEHGHMNFTYPLVRELVKSGERVIYYATAPFREKIEQNGAIFKSLGPEENFKPGHHQGGLYSVMSYSIKVAEKLIPDLLPILEADQPDLLLVDSMCVWGRLLAQIIRKPVVNFCSVFTTNEQLTTTEQMIKLSYGPLPSEVLLKGIEALNEYIEISQRIDLRYGTKSPNLVQFFSNQQALNLVCTSRYFHLRGEEFDQSYKFVGPLLPSSTPTTGLVNQFSEENKRPLIYISMGTIFNNLPEFYEHCLQAFSDSPYDIILSHGHKLKGVGLPSHFTVVPFVPQLEILQQANLFITHGGINSVCEGLWSEVPLLVFPQHGDQYLVANQVENLGAGLVLSPQTANPQNIRAMADIILNSPQYKDQAKVISASFHEAGGVSQAVKEIFAFKRQLRMQGG